MRSIGFVLSALLVAAPALGQTLVDIAPSPATPDLGPHTVLPVLVACTDVPTTTIPATRLRILAPHAADLHLGSSRGDMVVIDGGTPDGLTIGQRYFTRRVQPPVNREPISAIDPGSIRTSGWLTIVAADQQSALARIDYACTSIESSDYLEPYVEPALPAVIAEAGPTDFADLGRVLTGADRREAFGSGDFLSIDRGTARGLQSGARVSFFRDRQNGTPLVDIGTGVVVETGVETSKVVVQRASEAIRRDDFVGVQRP